MGWYRATSLRFTLPEGAPVSLVIYDLAGREVARLVDSYFEPGYHQVLWNGRDANGQEISFRHLHRPAVYYPAYGGTEPRRMRWNPAGSGAERPGPRARVTSLDDPKFKHLNFGVPQSVNHVCKPNKFLYFF